MVNCERELLHLKPTFHVFFFKLRYVRNLIICQIQHKIVIFQSLVLFLQNVEQIKLFDKSLFWFGVYGVNRDLHTKLSVLWCCYHICMVSLPGESIKTRVEDLVVIYSTGVYV